MDYIIVQDAAHEEVIVPNGLIRIWLDQALVFMRNGMKNIGTHECSSSSASKTSDEELVFMQYFDVLSKKQWERHGIDRSLGCIQLRWQRSEGEIVKSHSPNQFGFLQLIQCLALFIYHLLIPTCIIYPKFLASS